MPKKLHTINCFQRFTNTVVNFTDTLFYKLGNNVGKHPKKTIVICWIIVVLSAFGFLRFHHEKNPLKLWVPQHTQFVKDSEWLMEKLQNGFRVEVILITAPDVLTPEFLRYLLDIDDRIRLSVTDSGVKWTDVCFEIPKPERHLIRLVEGSGRRKHEKDASVTLNAALYCSLVDRMKHECFEKSILELWDYDREIIHNLTKNDIIETINTYNKNDILSTIKNYEDLLSGMKRNETGHIIAATAVHNFWMVSVNFTAIDMDKSGNIAGTADWASVEALDWENKFLEIIDNISHVDNNFTLYYTSSRSFGDISNSTMFQDIGILCIGVFIMVLYVQLVISKFNWLEARVVLGCVGLLSVGMSFVVGCGLCSLLGISYGPVHTSLPFLLMGLGVDDMFVIMACWDDLTKEQKQLPMPEKIGLMLKHGGVSITVTSVTDILAFLIGSYTILPCLESYCIYAAFGVLMTFVFAVTFFTACFVLDQERIDAKRNGIIICYKHENYRPNECSQKQILNKLFRLIYDKLILTVPGKILVIVVTLVCLGFSVESARKLEQRFDPEWFVPETTYFFKYLKMRKEYFPLDGFEAGIYIGAVNYTHELINIKAMVDSLEQKTNITQGIISWIDPFREFVQINFNTDIYEEVLSEEYFSLYLSMFLFTPRYAKYQANIHFESKLMCGVPAPKIIMSNIDFRFHYFSGPEQYLPAMHAVQDIAKLSNLTTGEQFATAWSKVFATWVTDEVIETEVWRNLQLALLCVMLCTILLIANIQTCFWIFVCVLFTMVNVCGWMQRWGLTIDLVSCIGLELAIGLCVDYATHIGHTFLTIKQGTKRDRALKTISSIGSAVLYGGLSTLIGTFMLSQSDAYIFQAFFKIFLLVIIFGLFHGVVFLPVIFSWIGPKPYNTHEQVHQDDIEVNQIK